MIIRIRHRDNPFVMIDKRCLNDSQLSWKAKGMLAYLLSKPDDWTVRMTQLIEMSKEGKSALRNAFQELQQAGYAELQYVRGEAGEMQGREWTIFEQPPKDRFSDLRENPTFGEPAPTNKDLVLKRNVPRAREAAEFPASLRSEDFLKAWEEWEKHRREKHSALTDSTRDKQWEKLVKWGVARAIAALNYSIEQGYHGVFEQNYGTTTDTKKPAGNRNTGTLNQGKASQYEGVGKVRGV